MRRILSEATYKRTRVQAMFTVNNSRHTLVTCEFSNCHEFVVEGADAFAFTSRGSRLRGLRNWSVTFQMKAGLLRR